VIDMGTKKGQKRKTARRAYVTTSGETPILKNGKIIYPKYTFGFRPYPKKKK